MAYKTLIGGKQLQDLYVIQGTGLKKATEIFSNTAAGLKKWIAGDIQIVGDYLQPVYRARTIYADYRDFAFSAPGAKIYGSPLELSVAPGLTCCKAGTGLYGAPSADALISVLIKDASGVFHEIPSNYWTYAVGESITDSDGYEYTVEPYSLLITKSVDELASILGITLNVSPRINVSIKSQDHFVYYLDVSPEQASYDLGYVDHFNSYFPMTYPESLDAFNEGLADGSFFEAGDTKYCPYLLVTVGQPDANGVWRAVKTLVQGTDYTFAVSDPDATGYKKGTLTLLDPATLVGGLTETQKLIVCYRRSSYGEDAAFLVCPDDNDVDERLTWDVSTAGDGSVLIKLNTNSWVTATEIMVTGNGPMKDFTEYESPLYDYTSYVNAPAKTLVVGEGVTRIGDYTFRNLNLTSIVLPDSLEEIGVGAFTQCRAVSAHLGANVKAIERSAFEYCWNLSGVYFGTKLEVIDDNAFKSCDALTEAVLPATCGVICEGAFSMCDNLAFVDMPGVEYIEPEAFYWSGLTRVNLGNKLISIGDSAFRTCQLTTVSLPATCSVVGGLAFNGNASMETFYINRAAGASCTYGNLALDFENDDPGTVLYVHADSQEAAQALLAGTYNSTDSKITITLF